MAKAMSLALKGVKFADAGCRILEFKSDVLEAAMKQARRARYMVIQARDTAGEFVDRTAVAVKKHPIKSVCCTFGTAFAIGAMTVWLVKKRA